MKLLVNLPTVAETETPSIFLLLSRSEGPDELVPVLSVPARRDARRLHVSGLHLLRCPLLQAGPPDVVEIFSAHPRFWSG